MSLQEGLVGHWTMDNIYLDIVKDSSANDNDGELINGATTSSESITGQSIDFDGNGQYMNVSADAGNLGVDGNKPKSVSLWAKIRSWQEGEGLFSMGRTGESLEDFSLRVNGGDTNNFRGQFWSEDIDFTFDADNRFAHFVVVHDGNEQRIYADTEIQGSQQETLDTSTNENFRVGFWDNLDRETLDGLVDDVRIYNRDISEKEIKQLYNMRNQQVRRI